LFQSTVRLFSSAQRSLRAPRSFADPHGSPTVHHRYRPAAVAVLDGDEVRPERAGDRRPVGGEQDGRPPAWIDPPARDREPNPLFGYVVRFIRFHERGFAAPANRFLRGLCFHYGVELHNFAPNAIS
jgi:hypothetical protein